MEDRQTLIGLFLIIVITMLWLGYNSYMRSTRPPQPEPKRAMVADTIAKAPDTNRVAPAEEKAPPKVAADTSLASETETISRDIQPAEEEKTITIETKYVRAVFSTKNGGNLVRWELKKYNYYLGGYVNLIQNNYLKTAFVNVDGKEIDLNQFNLFGEFTSGQTVKLDEGRPDIEIKFYLPVQNGKIIKRIRLNYHEYSFRTTIEFENLKGYVINRKFFMGWENGLPLTEENKKDDNNYAHAYAYMAGELEDVSAGEKLKKVDFNGQVDWVAIRTKYFLAAIIPNDPSKTLGATLSGLEVKENDLKRKIFSVSIDAAYEPTYKYSSDFTVYLGPLDYYVLKKYKVNLQKLVMNSGWYERTFRFISLLIIPAFEFLHRFIPNYGFVIIIFTILIKLMLHPLTKKSYQSMSEMQYLQPKLTELREKYKNDPQRMNKEMMKLYKEHGVNPLGGCLPNLLQMPLLVSLFIVFRSTIQLRGQPFILWITDLSRPDTLDLGFKLPILGDLHVLPILMGLTMIWQSKMSITDPKQKAMVYFMPIFLVFIFYSLPSGLNLYYAWFNILTMIQTYYIKKKMHPNGAPEPQPVTVKTDKKQSGQNRKK